MPGVAATRSKRGRHLGVSATTLCVEVPCNTAFKLLGYILERFLSLVGVHG